MTDKRQSDALHLADIADGGAWTFVIGVRKEIAAELRRQYAEIVTLRTGYEAARLEIASLQAQLEALASQAQPVGAAPVAELVTTAHGFETTLFLLPGHFDLPYGTHLLYTVPQPISQHKAQSALFDKQGFREWVLHNLPDDTIIGSSAYWADHLSEWAQRFVKAAPQPSPAAQGDALGAAFEAVRLLLCGLERYSFVLDDDGVVRRVRDRVGNWIEFDAAHELFDPAAVDAAIAAKQGGAA